MSRPVDVVGTHGAQRYAIEVKRLAASEHDDLHGKTMATLNTALEAEKVPIAVSVELAETFADTDIKGLVRHVKATLRREMARGPHWFPSESGWLTRYELYSAPHRAHARVIMLGDALHNGMREVTGVDEVRVRHKIQDAYGKFNRDLLDVANVVILQTDNTVHLGAVSQALYGREFIDFHRGSDEVTAGRYKDGLLSKGRYSALDAVVVARRSARRLFAPLDLALFSNPGARVSAEYRTDSGRSHGKSLGPYTALAPNVCATIWCACWRSRSMRKPPRSTGPSHTRRSTSGAARCAWATVSRRYH
jgi:hypothetical protein